MLRFATVLYELWYVYVAYYLFDVMLLRKIIVDADGVHYTLIVNTFDGLL